MTTVYKVTSNDCAESAVIKALGKHASHCRPGRVIRMPAAHFDWMLNPPPAARTIYRRLDRSPSAITALIRGESCLIIPDETVPTGVVLVGGDL